MKVLLRLRPAPDECDVGVHPYINTSEDSKFGFGLDELDEVDKILTLCENIQIIGLHCHLGSSIRDPSVYTYMGNFLSSATKMLDDKGIEIELYDVGGGICIDYKKEIPGFKNGDVQAHSEDTMHQGGTPGVDEFIKTIVNFLPPNKKLLIEPGRSLVSSLVMYFSIPSDFDILFCSEGWKRRNYRHKSTWSKEGWEQKLRRCRRRDDRAHTPTFIRSRSSDSSHQAQVQKGGRLNES